MQQQQVISLLFLGILAFYSVSAEDLIAKTCRSTPNRGVCEGSLRSDPRSSKADTVGLIEIMIDVVKSNFTDSLEFVNQLLKESPPPPPTKKKALKRCAFLFQFVADTNVKLAKSAVEKHNPKFGVDAMRDAAVEAHECGDAVKGSAGVSPLIQRIKVLDVVSNVAAAMISILE